MRAPDLSDCAYTAEQHLKNYPGLLSDEYECWVGSALELPQHAPADDAAVLHGPFSLLGTPGGQDEVYLRRDEGDPFWINVHELREMKPLEDCIYDDPPGWPTLGIMAPGAT